MKIAYDHQIFNLQNHGGISRYFFEIISALKNRNQEILLPHVHTTNTLFQQLNGQKDFALSKLSKLKGYKNLLEYYNRHYSLAVLKEKPDLFHPTYYNPYFLKEIGNIPFVLTIHDMIHEKLSYKGGSLDKAMEHKANLAQKASHIIAVSEHTKKDILEIYKMPEHKISVIHHGYSNLNSASTEVPNLANKAFILYVGERGGYKNFDWLLKSSATVLQKENILLVCVGGKDFSKNEIQLIENQNIKSKVVFLKNIEDTQLKWLYQQAIAFVYPSIYEGFGMPILEAMGQSCPVILPNSSCFPEIAGDAALFYEKDDNKGFTQQLQQLIQDPSIRNEFIQKGLQRKDEFTWEKSAQKHLETYQTIS